MKNPLRFFLIYFSILFAYASAQAQVSTCVKVVTAAQYCDFLNHIATERDLAHLYNEAMTSDPTTTSIARVGEPGRWYYEVIAGRENFLINYVNRQQAEASFAGRLQAAGYRLQEEANDNYLSCNSDTFEVEVSSPMLTLVSSSPTSTSTSNFNSYIEDVGSVVGLLGLVALCPEFITLEEFRTAAAHPDNAGAERLVVIHDAEGNDVIREQAAGNGASASGRSQNLEIIHHLRTALESEYSSEAANTFIRAQISPLSLTERSSRLGIERLRGILTAADLARDQRVVAVQPLASSGHQNNNVIPAQGINSSTQAVMPSAVKESPLLHSVLSRYLENKSLHAKEYLKKIQADGKIVTKDGDYDDEYGDYDDEYGDNNKKNRLANNIISAAQRWHQYIKNCMADNTRNRLNSYGLAAIDRAEEALRLRIEAAENIVNNEVSSSFSEAAVSMEAAAKYIVNALLAERAENKPLAEQWLKTADSFFQVSRRLEVKGTQEKRPIQNQKEAKRLEETARLTRSANASFASVAEYMLKSVEAKLIGNHHLAELWAESGRYEQNAANKFDSAAKSSGAWDQKKAKILYEGANQEQKIAQQDAEKAKAIAHTLSQEIDCNNKAAAARKNGNHEEAELWAEVARQYRTDADNRCQAANIKNKDQADQLIKSASSAWQKAQKIKTSIETVANLLANQRKYLVEAEEANTNGHQEATGLLAEAARQSQVAAEYQLQAAQAFAAGDEEKAKRLEKSSQSAKDIANRCSQASKKIVDYSAQVARHTTQAREARLAENEKEANLLDQAVTAIQSTIEYIAQGAHAFAAGNKEEAERLDSNKDLSNVWSINVRSRSGAAAFAQEAADRLEQAAHNTAKARQTQRAENYTGAVFLTQVARQSRIAAEHQLQAAKAVAAGDEEESKRLEKFLESAQEIVNKYSHASQEATKHSAQVEKYTALSREASFVGNEEEASLWTQAATATQASLDYIMRAAHAFAAGNKEESERLWKSYTGSAASSAEKAAFRFEQAANNMVQAQEAQGAENNIKTDLLTQAARQSRIAAEDQLQAAEALAAGDEAESKRLEKSSRSAQEIANKYSQASQEVTKHSVQVEKYTTQAREARFVENEEEASLWDQAAAATQRSIAYIIQAAEAFAAGNKEEAERLCRSYNFVGPIYLAKKAAGTFEKAANNMAQAQEAQGQENNIKADLLTQAARQSQSAAEHQLRAANALAAGDKEESKHLEESSRSAEGIADQCSRISQRVDDYLAQLDRYTAQAIEASLAGDQEKAELLSLTAQQYQIANEKLAAAAQALALGQPDEFKKNLNMSYSEEAAANNILQIANSISRYLADESECISQADQAKAGGHREEADLLDQAVEQYRTTIEALIQKAHAYGAGDQEEAQRLEKIVKSARAFADRLSLASQNVACFFADRNKYTLEAEKAKAAGHKRGAALWQEAAHQSQQAVEDEMKMVMETNKKGMDYSQLGFSGWDSMSMRAERIKRLDKNINLSKDIADQFVKAAEARAQGSYALANLWAEAAAKAKIKENEEESKELSETATTFAGAMDCLLDSASYQARAAKARAGKNQVVADFWTEAASQSQAAADIKVQAAQAEEAGDEGEVDRLSELASAAMCFAKSAEANVLGYKKWADLWKDAAQQFQKAAEYHAQSAQANIKKHQTEAQRWAEAAHFASLAAHSFAAVPEAKDKTQSTSSPEAAQALSKFAELALSNARQFSQKAEKAKPKKSKVSKNLKTDSSRIVSSEPLAESKVSEISPNLSKNVVVTDHDSVTINNIPAENEVGSLSDSETVTRLTDYSERATHEGTPGCKTWKQAANQIKAVQNYRAQAAVAEARGNQAKAARLHEAANLAINAAESFAEAAQNKQNSAEAQANGNRAEAQRCSRAAEAALEVARSRVQTAEAKARKR